MLSTLNPFLHFFLKISFSVNIENVLYNFSNSYYIFCCKCSIFGLFMIVFKIALTPVQDFADLSGEIIFESMKRFITKPNLKMFAFDIAPEIIREKTTI